jgi:hypothetical protein
LPCRSAEQKATGNLIPARIIPKVDIIVCLSDVSERQQMRTGNVMAWNDKYWDIISKVELRGPQIDGNFAESSDKTKLPAKIKELFDQ